MGVALGVEGGVEGKGCPHGVGADAAQHAVGVKFRHEGAGEAVNGFEPFFEVDGRVRFEGGGDEGCIEMEGHLRHGEVWISINNSNHVC